MLRAISSRVSRSCGRKSSLHPDRHSRRWTQHCPTDGGLISTVTRKVFPSRFVPVAHKSPTVTAQIICSVHNSCLLMSLLPDTSLSHPRSTNFPYSRLSSSTRQVSLVSIWSATPSCVGLSPLRQLCHGLHAPTSLQS